MHPPATLGHLCLWQVAYAAASSSNLRWLQAPATISTCDTSPSVKGRAFFIDDAEYPDEIAMRFDLQLRVFAGTRTMALSQYVSKTRGLLLSQTQIEAGQ